MGTYLATILGVCALATPFGGAAAIPNQILLLVQETQPPTGTAPSSPPSETPSPQVTQEPQQTQPEAEKKPAAKKPKTTKKRHPQKTPAVAAASNAAPEKKVVKNGGTADPVVQLAPGVTPEQASNQRQTTSQMLGATDTNLKQISSRQLNSTQQDSVSQIRKYMEQAKAAEKAGDVQRAQNLASKALLLSDDLVKQ